MQTPARNTKKKYGMEDPSTTGCLGKLEKHTQLNQLSCWSGPPQHETHINFQHRQIIELEVSVMRKRPYPSNWKKEGEEEREGGVVQVI